MEKSESIESYFSHMLDIKNKMTLNQYDLLVKTFVEKVLNILPIKFDHVVAML